ncbi:MAG: winged helix-turn-helix domain-containing protein [Ekhidna sp.]
MASQAYHVGEWLVEPSLNRISKKDEVKKVEPQLMEVLNLLAKKSGEIVTKKELKDAIWSDVVVTENVFTRAISSLRKVLADDPSNPTYIETISKTGYRLLTPTKRVSKQTPIAFFTLQLPRKPTVLILGILLIFSFGAFVLLEAFSPEPPLLTYEPVPIANSNATEYWPSISPDGRLVAFSSNREEGNWDIYIQPIGSQTALRMTQSTAAELRPVWSKDGNFLYFIRYEEGGASIYKQAIVGGNEVRIASAPVHSRGDFDISDDGEWMLFNQRDDKHLALSISRVSLKTGAMEMLSACETGYTGDLNPRFSPDNKQIAFIREKNPSSMYLYLKDLATGMLTQLTTTPQSINGFDWSKDGTHLVYGSDQSGLYKLWNVNVTTQKSTVIRAGDYQMVMPRVAKTGRHIYAKMKDNVNIWQFDISSQTASMWYGSSELNLNPVFSPDGSKVCFTMKKGTTYEVWVANADGNNQVPITQFIGSYLTSPSWSSDGKSIFFQGFIDGQSDVFMVNSKGGIPVNLTSSAIDEHTPFASENGAVYFSSNDDRQWKIEQLNLDTKRRSTIIESGYAPQYHRKKIYYVKKEEQGLWQFDLADSTEKLLIASFHPMHWGAYAVADAGVYYLNSNTKRFEIHDFTSGKSAVVYQPLKRIPRMGITLSLSPDQQHLLFAQIDVHDADIMLLEEQVN